MPELVKSVCRVLYYRQLTRLAIAGVECIASLAIDSILQMHLIQVTNSVASALLCLVRPSEIEGGGEKRDYGTQGTS
jgi:hypothetical protein